MTKQLWEKTVVGKPSALFCPSNDEEMCLYLQQFCFQIELPHDLGRGHQTVVEYEILHLQMMGYWYAYHYLGERKAELLRELESERGAGFEPMAHAAFALLELCKCCVQSGYFHHSSQLISVSYQNFYQVWICLLVDDIQSELKRGFRKKEEITSIRREIDQGRDLIKKLENIQVGKEKAIDLSGNEELGLVENSALGALITSIAAFRTEPVPNKIWRAWNYYLSRLKKVATKQSEPDNGPMFYIDEQGQLWLKGKGNQSHLYPEEDAQKISAMVAAQTNFWKRHPVRIR
ncbi:hypothetical protein [Leptolyngbya sp. NIES-2104]|uniref:hypothetical protein n=1 Tax=Leptolyngbya sp. NIES-2104 TaxID=1552121 RepID=UPI0006ECCC7F|nr:hypothetical protein [Leptolyngbya sp. NIES-2104]GAP99099.1 hypothetical protein NIES2104_56560 [Leptolyngbya sp. NIES-2104]